MKIFDVPTLTTLIVFSAVIIVIAFDLVDMLLMVKGYLVTAQLAPDLAMGPLFTDWPGQTIPVFVAMMFSGTLGGNATVVGASANVVSAGICASYGKPVSYISFMRYGVPITFCQLLIGALYVLVLFFLNTGY